MGNLLDYVTWRGDLPFSFDPFNEVDNLIFAELVYLNYCGFPEDGSPLPLPRAAESYFQQRSKPILLKTNKEKLLELAANSERFKNTEICFYRNEIDPQQEFQFAAISFCLEDGSAYLAFRGTDSSLAGWKESLDLSFEEGSPGQIKAVEYLNMAGAVLDRPLRVGGHSKGGNFAAYAAAFCAPEIRERITDIYANDSPGFRADMIRSEAYQRILPKIRRILPGTSVVGYLMYSDAVPRIIRSSATAMGQHDGFTWNVHRNRFVTDKQSELGAFLDRSLDKWTDQLNDDTRKSVSDALYTLLQATGKQSITEIRAQRMKSAESILAALPDLPEKNRRDLLSTLSIFIRTGRESAIAEAQKLIEENMENKKQETDPEIRRKWEHAAGLLAEARKNISNQ